MSLQQEKHAAIAELSPSKTEAAIFGRLLDNADRSLNSQLAKYLLSLEFSKEEKTRMHELAVKNQAGALLESERAELRNYLSVGNMLAILQSKARKRLKHSKEVNSDS